MYNFLFTKLKLDKMFYFSRGHISPVCATAYTSDNYISKPTYP